MEWEPAASARLKKAPFFIRFFIKQKAEGEASRRGLAQVTTQLLDELKSKEHRPEG
jgi:hypothetical protein